MSNEPLAPRRGWLKNGNPPGDLSNARRCGVQSKRNRRSCRAPAMPNGRCRMHGGGSTGPRTQEGLARSRKARFRHGFHSRPVRDARARARWVLREARRLIKAGVTFS